MKNILITGATGFIGSALVNSLTDRRKFLLRAVLRGGNYNFPLGTMPVQISDITAFTDWGKALKKINVIVHLAARAHVLNKTAAQSLDNFREVNVAGTLNLAKQATTAGVTRFIFISSIGVNGNWNSRPFCEGDIPNPVEPYAVSKMEAEQALQQLAEKTGLEVVIIRPPLVYGPKAPGNFGRLLRIANKGIPLPLGAIYNQRSFVALDNLVDLIATCIDHPAAANQLFLAGDGEDLSTTQLLKRIGKAFGRPVYLIPVPAKILELGAILLRKQEVIRRLCGSLQVDISKAKQVLGWVPPVSVDEGLRKAVENLND